MNDRHDEPSGPLSGSEAPRRPDVRLEVLAAIEAGRLPAGGPSDLAAQDRLDEMSPDYWQRWGEDAAERVRSQAAAVRCTCIEPDHELPELAPDGRCSRCWGRRADHKPPDVDKTLAEFMDGA